MSQSETWPLILPAIQDLIHVSHDFLLSTVLLLRCQTDPSGFYMTRVPKVRTASNTATAT